MVLTADTIKKKKRINKLPDRSFETEKQKSNENECESFVGLIRHLKVNQCMHYESPIRNRELARCGKLIERNNDRRLPKYGEGNKHPCL